MMWQADVLGVKLSVPDEKESVLLGAAVLGMTAADQDHDLHTVVSRLSCSSSVMTPCDEVRQYHQNKYQVFTQMMRDQIKYRQIMKQNS